MSNWISVEERLPKDCQTVLALQRGYRYDLDVKVCEYEVASPHGIHTQTRFRLQGTLREFTDVVLWQPLPAPPSEVAPEATPTPFSQDELAALREIAAKIPKVDHPRTYPEEARKLFGDLLRLKYNEDGRWRIDVELADGSKAIIGVNNRCDGEFAKSQIRGMALELLGHWLTASRSEAAAENDSH